LLAENLPNGLKVGFKLSMGGFGRVEGVEVGELNHEN
jgi:hypothetical protein